jgi:hypothetical protein
LPALLRRSNPLIAVASPSTATAATTTAATTTATAATTTTTATATAAIVGLVDPDVAAAEVFTVQCLSSGIGTGGFHLDESEAPGAAGLAIGDHVDRLDGSVLLEHFSEFCFRGAEGKVSDVQLLRQFGSLLATQVVPSSGARIAEIQVGPSNRRIACETDSCLARLGSKPQLGLAGLGEKGRPDWKHEETGRTRVLCADQKMPLGDKLNRGTASVVRDSVRWIFT